MDTQDSKMQEDLAPDCWRLSISLRQIADDGQHEVVNDVLRMFREDTQDKIKRLRIALEQVDYPLAQKLAHALRGSCAQMGAGELSRSALMMERTSLEDLPQQSGALLEQIDRQWLAVDAAIADYLAVTPAQESKSEDA